MSFATDRIGLNLLIKNDIFNKELCVNTIKESKFKFIIDFEVRMSEIIMNQGYEIKSLQFSEQKNDVQYLNRYKGTTINPLEIMFIKTNRINDLIIKNYTEWFLNKNLKKYNIIYFENPIGCNY